MTVLTIDYVLPFLPFRPGAPGLSPPGPQSQVLQRQDVDGEAMISGRGAAVIGQCMLLLKKGWLYSETALLSVWQAQGEKRGVSVLLQATLLGFPVFR